MTRTRRPTDGENEYREKPEDEWSPAGPKESPQKPSSSGSASLAVKLPLFEAEETELEALFTPQSPVEPLLHPTEFIFHPQLYNDDEEKEALTEELREAIKARYGAMHGTTDSVEEADAQDEEEEESDLETYESMIPVEADDLALLNAAVSPSHKEKVADAVSTTSSGRNSAIAFGQFVS